MPVQPRASDTYTQDNLLLGFSQVTFTPALAAGGFGTAVPMGFLSGEELQKEVETLELERGDAGLITVARELVSKFTAGFQLQLFNFRADLFQYLIASSSITPVTADAVAVVTNETFSLPGSLPFENWTDLSKGDVNEASIEVTCGTVTDEAVGTGTGAVNNFFLDYKVKAVGDVTSVTVGGVVYTPIAVGAAAAGNEVEVTVGEAEGAHLTASGSLEFYVGGILNDPPNGDAIVATYTPSFSTTGTDIVNLTDFVFDTVLGRIRVLKDGVIGAFTQAGGSQPLEIDYTYDRKASNDFKPFTQQVFQGKATINHLPDVGINFIYTIPSASIRITDDALTFDAEDFALGTLILNILDAGGTDRFGTISLSSETEANA